MAIKTLAALANYDSRLATIDTRLTVLTYMMGTNLVVTLGVLGKLLVI
jgi:hypothetical protein